MCVFSWAFWLEFLFVSLSSNEHSCRGKIRQVSSMLLRISLYFFSSIASLRRVLRRVPGLMTKDAGTAGPAKRPLMKIARAWMNGLRRCGKRSGGGWLYLLLL